MMYFSTEQMANILNKPKRTLNGYILKLGIAASHKRKGHHMFSEKVLDTLKGMTEKAQPRYVEKYYPYYVREEFHIYESKINKK